PCAYLMTRRIERPMALLRRCDTTVTDAWFEVRCSSLGPFSARCAELVGVPPSVYQQRCGGGMRRAPSCVAKQVARPIRARGRAGEGDPAGDRGSGVEGDPVRNPEAQAA